MKHLLTFTLSAVMFVVLPVPSLEASPFVVDQSHTSFSGFFNLRFSGVTGQEFTPTLDSLDVVELLFDGPDGSFPPAIEGQFSVGIRQGSVTGAVVGTSSPVTLLTGIFREVVRFDFPTRVPLVPDDLYVIEINLLSDPDLPFFVGHFGGFGTPPSNYSRGRGILEGEPLEDFDLFFREGQTNVEVVSEPGTLALAVLGTLAVFGCGRMRPQGTKGSRCVERSSKGAHS